MKSKYVIFFVLLAFLGIGSIRAETATVEYLDNIYSNRIGNDKVYSGKLGFLIVNGEVVYCLEPYLIIGTEYQINNNYLNQFSKEDLEYFELVADYVKNRVKERNVYYYMAAQELIWERIIGDNSVYWTTEKNGGTEIDISLYKYEINAYLANYYLKPSFEGEKVYDEFFTTYILEDTNHILNQYEIVSDTKSQVWIDDNKLYIKILSSDEEEIKLVRKIKEGISTYYHSDTNQDLVKLDGTIINEVSIKVKANNNYFVNLALHFYDQEFVTLINGGIRFKIHNLDTDFYSEDFITYDGNFYSILESGHYEIIFLDVPKNYLTHSNHSFEITEDISNNDYVINYYLEKAVGKITINNYQDLTNFSLYALDNIYNIHENIIYKKDELLSEYSLFQNDQISVIVPLGDYYLLDHLTDRKYEIHLKYQDQSTKYVEYILDINPEPLEDNKKNNDGLNNEENFIEKDEAFKEHSNDNKQMSNENKQKQELNDNLKTQQTVQNIEQNIAKNEALYKNSNFDSEMKILPNTSDYMGFIKGILVIFIFTSAIKLIISNE